VAEGFRDSVGSYMTATRHRGVWVSDEPLDANEGAKGDTLISVSLPDGLLELCEWVQTPSFGCREALIPARVLNRLARRIEAE
jgi:hypothetical protein